MLYFKKLILNLLYNDKKKKKNKKKKPLSYPSLAEN